MLAREWVSRGHPAAVALALDPGSIVPDQFAGLKDAGVEIFPMWTPARRYLAERSAYRRAFADWRPDIVHTHGYRADLLAGSAARSLGLTRVSTFHGFTGGDWKNRLYERLQIRSARSCDAVIAVSRPVRERLLRGQVPPDRLHLIPNALSRTDSGLDRNAARRELGLPEQGTVIGWVGRLSQEKGPDVLVRSIPLLSSATWQVSFIGGGPEQRAAQRLADELGLANRIRWHGQIPGAARCYAAFDCLVLSSRTEGTPIVLLEAMARGVPVVATRVGGVPDVMGEDEGWLIPPENPQALANAIGQVITQPAITAGRVSRARVRVNRDHAAGPWIERHAELYRALRLKRN
jgi:glycosyltransferase involved in cell wall biosynthesis